MKNNYKLIDSILLGYKPELGSDYQRYYNHVMRIFELSKMMDGREDNEEKYAIAAGFHDLGIWTNGTFDYLEPSIDLCLNYLKANGREEWGEEISLMIDMHHKRSKYRGDFQLTVENFRRADWIDVTLGRKLFGTSKANYDQIKNKYPTIGFHKFLVVQTIKNLFKSPLNPLPMFKK